MASWFSRFVGAVASVVDSVVDAGARALGFEPEPAAPEVEPEPSTPIEVPTIIDEYDAEEARQELTEDLGPVDTGEDDRDVEDIELDQWAAFFDAHPNQVPHDFAQALRDLIDDGFDLDDDIYSTIELDAPDGDT